MTLKVLVFVVGLACFPVLVTSLLGGQEACGPCMTSEIVLIYIHAVSPTKIIDGHITLTLPVRPKIVEGRVLEAIFFHFTANIRIR